MGLHPDKWTDAASALPLAFAQVREDPRLDMALAEMLPAEATVVMIASGGDTAAMVARLPLRALHLVDVNPAQLALTKLKLHLDETADPDEAAAILGHEDLAPSDRGRALRQRLHLLNLPDGVLGPLEWVEKWGPDYAGRYERTFAALRQELEPVQAQIDELLQSHDPGEASRMASVETRLGQALDAAFGKVMSLSSLVRLFGNEATQNPARPFHRHFAGRLRVVLERLPAATNPFLWQMLAGRFPPGHRYDWLGSGGEGKPFPTKAIHWHQDRMREVLGRLPEEGADLIHLSNILDWLTEDDAMETLRSACTALRPGGRVIVRQLNSTLDIERLGPGLQWDRKLGAAMEREGRSFFYPRILVGEKP